MFMKKLPDGGSITVIFWKINRHGEQEYEVMWKLDRKGPSKKTSGTSTFPASEGSFEKFLRRMNEYWEIDESIITEILENVNE